VECRHLIVRPWSQRKVDRHTAKPERKKHVSVYWILLWSTDLCVGITCACSRDTSELFATSVYNGKLNAFCTSCDFWNSSKYVKLYDGEIVNRYEPIILKKLLVQVPVSDGIRFNGWFRFSRIRRFGWIFGLRFSSLRFEALVTNDNGRKTEPKLFRRRGYRNNHHNLEKLSWIRVTKFTKFRFSKHRSSDVTYPCWLLRFANSVISLHQLTERIWGYHCSEREGGQLWPQNSVTSWCIFRRVWGIYLWIKVNIYYLFN
jgi:hypothetical protein